MIDCPADSFVPLPTTSSPPTLTYKELRTRAKAACNAAKLLSEQGCTDRADIELTQALAHNAIRNIAKGAPVPTAEIVAATNTPEGAIFVEGILTAYDMEVVQDSKRLRHYVTNKLVVESENPDSRIRMKALELLGKISDVGLFAERTEVTINNRSTVELETSLRDKLRRLMNTTNVEDATIIQMPRPDVSEALKDI